MISIICPLGGGYEIDSLVCRQTKLAPPNFIPARGTYLVGFSELVFSSFFIDIEILKYGYFEGYGWKRVFLGDMVHFWLLFWRMWLKVNLIRLPIIVWSSWNPIKDNIYIITNRVFIIIIKMITHLSIRLPYINQQGFYYHNKNSQTDLSFQNLYKNRTYT